VNALSRQFLAMAALAAGPLLVTPPQLAAQPAPQGATEATLADYRRALSAETRYEGLVSGVVDELRWSEDGARATFRRSLVGGDFECGSCTTWNRRPRTSSSPATSPNYTKPGRPARRLDPGACRPGRPGNQVDVDDALFPDAYSMSPSAGGTTAASSPSSTTSGGTRSTG
jgi:hypothetical protein